MNKNHKINYKIKYFGKKRPNKKTQIAVVRIYREAFAYLKDPSEEVILAAIKNNYRYLKSIDNPSKEMIMAAISQNWEVINDIKSPDFDMINLAIYKDYYGKYFKTIPNPTNAMKIAHVKARASNIEDIQNISTNLYIKFYNANPLVIDYIQKFDKKLIKAIMSSISISDKDNIYYSLGEKRKHIAHRLAFNPDSPPELIQKLILYFSSLDNHYEYINTINLLKNHKSYQQSASIILETLSAYQ